MKTLNGSSGNIGAASWRPFLPPFFYLSSDLILLFFGLASSALRVGFDVSRSELEADSKPPWKRVEECVVLVQRLVGLLL